MFSPMSAQGTSEWDLLDHCDGPLYPTQQNHEGGSETHLFGELQSDSRNMSKQNTD